LDAGRSEQAGHGQGELGARGGELGAVGRGRAGRGRPGTSSWQAASASDCRRLGARELLAAGHARAAGCWAGVWPAERDKGERERSVGSWGAS
jgi:hypothetical protein